MNKRSLVYDYHRTYTNAGRNGPDLVVRNRAASKQHLQRQVGETGIKTTEQRRLEGAMMGCFVIGTVIGVWFGFAMATALIGSIKK